MLELITMVIVIILYGTWPYFLEFIGKIKSAKKKGF
jgi:hypothetical protein